jgi:flagellar hook-length control protein FliK
MKAAHTMMSTLNSSLLSLNNGKLGNPMPQVQPPVAEAPSKRFAQLMAKNMAKAQTSAPSAVPPAPAKPTTPDNAVQNSASNEASRAEANARANAKAAARALATRAQVKAPASEMNRPNEPHQASIDSASAEANEADNKSDAKGAALSADMAAWVATLNRSAVQSAADASAQPGGETDVTESALAAQMSTQMATQAADQTVADKNTQVLREKADADRQERAQHGVTNQRITSDQSSARAGSGGAGPSGRDGQPSDSRGVRDALEARASARSQADSPTSATSTATSTATAANAVSLLSKEVNGPAAETAITAASKSTDFSALMAGSMNAANGTSSTPETLTVSLPTPVNAPEFREALGVQVSLLARDGVQTAELHLNPAEMGPVSIQIVMDGTQARVDFGADVAATRAAIEASMPELASALLDAGFTLAGGGVSQHAKGQGQAAGDSRPGTTRRNIIAGAPSLATPTTQAPQQRAQLSAGGVDLFA